MIWKRLYSTKSGRDKGTIFNLQQVLNRTSVHADPSKDLKAAEDFFGLVWEAHVVAAAKYVMSSSTGSHSGVTDISKTIVCKYVELPSCVTPTTAKGHVDGVHAYAMDLLNLGLLYHGFRDAVREGDGDRVVIYWKAMMILFRASQKWNYSKEAFLLLLQLTTSSERVAEAIKWSRFINRKGRVGCNVPCDLAMEYLNRRLKCVIRQLGANVRPSAIVRASRSIRVVDTVCELFEHSVEASISGDHHTMAKDIKDFNLVLGVLMEKELFKEESGRSHRQFQFSLLC